MTITLNGQFLLCVLAEELMKLHGLKIIQINTDGLTIRYPKQYTGWVKETMEWWEGITNLQMEHIDYSRMFVRDVNNYVAEYKDGSVKTKGTYSSDRVWSANHSQLVVSKVAVDVLLNGGSIIEKLMSHNDIMDFMIKVKAPRNSKLMIDDVEIQRISRVLVTKDGGCLVKIMPPLPKSKTGEQRRIRQLMGRKVTVFNNIAGADSEMIDYDYYRREVEKLLF
jgi:DNA polymerase elongation subunit (family B)